MGSLYGVLAFGTVPLASANPLHDTPTAAGVKVRAPAELRLVDWAAKNRSGLSLTVVSLPEGRKLTEVDGAIARNPASVSKLVTAFVALRSLGSNHQFKTTIHGKLVSGHVERLVIRGEGDPSFTGDHIQGIAARLAAMGLTHVDRAIVVDQSYFDPEFVPPAFDQQPNEWAAFRAPVSAAALDRNRITLSVLPTNPRANARVFVEPLGTASISGKVRVVERDTKGQAIKWSIRPGAELPTVSIEGEIGATESAYISDKRRDDPRRSVGYALGEALRTRGLQITPAVELGSIDGAPLLHTHWSVPLGGLLHRLGKDSDNFAAEMLLKTLGARADGSGSSEAGAKVVIDALSQLGIVGTELRWVNGSGLFDANRISTNQLTQVLAAAHKDARLAPEYLAQLSIGGTDGTLAKRLRDLPKGCVVRAKTGTLRAVVSLGGYVARPDGRWLGFTVIAESVNDQIAARAEIDRFVESLCSLAIDG